MRVERIPFDISHLNDIENGDWWLETEDGRGVAYSEYVPVSDYPVAVKVRLEGSGMHKFYYSEEGQRKDDGGKDKRWDLMMCHNVVTRGEKYANENMPNHPDVSWDDMYERIAEAYNAGYEAGRKEEADKYTYEGYGNYRKNCD